MRRTRKSVIFIIMLFFITFFASMSLDTTTKAYTDEFLARLMDNELTLVPREEGEIFIMNRCEEAVYSYTSSNNKIVYVDNKYHSVMGISKGTATITVTESLDGVSRSLGEVKVTVVGKYIEKELTIAYSDGLESGYFPIYNREDDAIYTFKSSDPKTVEIRANGYLYAHKYGTAYISVTEKYKGKVTKLGKTKVNVVKPRVPKKIKMPIIKNFGIGDLVLYPNFTKDYKYTSTNKDIIEINENTGEFTLKKYGSVKVNVFEVSKGKSKKIGSCMAEIIPTTFDPNYDYQKIEVYTKTDITFFHYALKNENELATFSLESGDNSIITVTSKEQKDKHGNKTKSYYFEGVQPGRTTLKIYEEFNGEKNLVATVNIMITEYGLKFMFNEGFFGPCDQEGIFNTTMYLDDYDSESIVDGLIKEPDEDLTNVTFVSSNEQVVKIDNNGKITLVSEGTAIILASYGGITTKLKISVEKSELNR